MAEAAVSPLTDPVFSNPQTTGSASASRTPVEPTGDTKADTFEPMVPMIVGPEEERDFKSFLTPDQQAEIIAMFTTAPRNEPTVEQVDPATGLPLNPPSRGNDIDNNPEATRFPPGRGGMEGQLQDPESVGVPSAGDDRSRAALMDALALAEQALASELGLLTTMSGLRGAYYDKERFRTDKQIRADFEARGVFESSANDIARREAEADISGRQFYNDLQDYWDFSRRVHDTQARLADRVYGYQQSVQDREHAEAVAHLWAVIQAYGGQRPSTGIFSPGIDDPDPSLFV